MYNIMIWNSVYELFGLIDTCKIGQIYPSPKQDAEVINKLSHTIQV